MFLLQPEDPVLGWAGSPRQDLGVRGPMQSLSPFFAQNMLLAWHLKDLVKAGIRGRSCSSR